MRREETSDCSRKIVHRRGLHFTAQFLIHYSWVNLSEAAASFVSSSRRQASLSASSTSLQSSIFGLNEDGDFAMMGINMQEDTSTANDDDSNMMSSPLPDLSTLGISSMQAPAASTSDQGTITDSLGIDPEEQDRMEIWLDGVIPTLQLSDLQRYAQGLVQIGFDPNCPSRFELKMEDLHFMKVLHQRFIYHEIMRQKPA